MSIQIQLNSQIFTPQRIFCIGRNYVKHIEELKNEVPTNPVIFMKPASCLVPVGSPVGFPAHGSELHHEAEIVVLIGKNGKAERADQAKAFIAGLSVGFDLTLRDVQNRLKEKGLPWETAKAFDDSSPIGDFVPFSDAIDLKNIDLTCFINDEIRQQGNSNQMIYPIQTLIVELSKIWELKAGDLIYTGTPAGVSELKRGDRLAVESSPIGRFEWVLG